MPSAAAAVIKREGGIPPGSTVPAIREDENETVGSFERRHVLPGTTFPRLESRRHMDDDDGVGLR